MRSSFQAAFPARISDVDAAPELPDVTPQQILDHNDSGDLWPTRDGPAFNELQSAYGHALAVRRLRIARGEVPVGYKVGFTNRTIWSRYNVYAPIWGFVWNTTISYCEGAGNVPLAHVCQPRIEPEAVFGFRAMPRRPATLDDLFNALDWVAPGFEIVQSHSPGWKFIAPETVADGGLHGRLLVGPKTPIAKLARDSEQLHRTLASARVRLQRNGALVEEGSGANVLDSPLHALLHFVTELRSCPGAPDLAANDVVTTGTWTDAWPVAAGQRWSARFDVLPALEINFK
jgi:2-oxo-3-hexenedioate decarboxylase